MSNMPIIQQNFCFPDPVRHGINKMPGSVKAMSWSPDGYCLAVAWSTHGLALWSVFGSLLYSTLPDQIEVTRFLFPLSFCWTLRGFHLWTVSSFIDDPDRRAREENLAAFRERLMQNCNALPSTQRQIAINVAKMRADLGLDEDAELEDQVSSNSKNQNFLMIFHLAKSALVSNPTSDNHLHLLFCTPDTLFVTVRRFLHSRRNMLHIPVPQIYIRANFPVKFAALNTVGSHLVVAGRRGLAVCFLSSLQWRLFGNVTQEQAFEVHAGLAWWGRFICLCAFNHSASHCEIRCYPSTEKLDDRFASILALDNSIRPLLLDVVGDRLILFSTDSHYRSFTLAPGTKSPEVVITPHFAFNLSSFFPYAYCLTRICPFALQSHHPSLQSNLARDDHHSLPARAEDDGTILVIYAGNLLLFPKLVSSLVESNGAESNAALGGFLGFVTRQETTPKKYRDSFNPTLIASNVEFLWACTTTPATSTWSSCPAQRSTESPETSDDDGDDDATEKDYSTAISSPEAVTQAIPLLNGSIWLHCGADGVKIWFPLELGVVRQPSGGLPEVPLSPNFDKKAQFSYLPPATSTKASRRVMLSLRLNGLTYPLTIFLDKAVVVTIQSDYLRTERSFSDTLADPCIQMPFYCVQFKTNLFLPHLLKDLLLKNLSGVAFELASAYQHLPYFQHILELLLHEVLEEEATSKVPIPDPLLPQVAAFIEHFPHFLDVVVQCTRKTEVTWWRHLFCALGRRPKDVFDQAMSLGQLETAASCLVILQNSESHATSKQCALILLEKVIQESHWHLVKDLMRFLKATTMSEKCSSPPANGTEVTLNEVDSFVERLKCRFLREGSWRSLEEIFANVPPPPLPPSLLSSLSDSFDTVDLVLPHWVLEHREHVLDVDDWPKCFLRLHSDFSWFLPVGGQRELSRPGIARAINGTSEKVLTTTSRSVCHSTTPEEALTFTQASRTCQQVLLLLNHLLWIVRELNASGSSFGNSEESILCWTTLVAVLVLDKQALSTVFSLSSVKPDTTLTNGPQSRKVEREAGVNKLLLRILNGLGALEAMISANPQAAPDYFAFFNELKPITRKFFQDFIESTTPPPPEVSADNTSADESSANAPLSIPDTTVRANEAIGRGTRESQAEMSFVPPSTMQTVWGQDRAAAEFESTADVHLVNPESPDGRSGPGCTVS
uniref:Protein RIC1 homolog n=2 Tax=Mesocestoides corti TaxID=53468 RepID=A0A5K3F2C6_MESCO